MLKQVFDQLFWRPMQALAATIDMLGKDTTAGQKADAILSRAIHGMSRLSVEHPYEIRGNRTAPGDSARQPENNRD
jgi:hypothetical protein